MGSLSDYLEDKLVDHVHGNTAYSPVATVYLALSTTTVNDAGSVTEPSGNGYARKAVTFGAAASRAISNSAQVTYDQATGDWGTQTDWAIFDALSGGNMLAYGTLAAPKAVVSGNIPSVAVGEVTITVNTGGMSTYLANKLLDFVFRNQAFSQPTLYLALVITSAVTDASTGSTINEPSGNNYSRKALGSFDVAASGATANSATETFAAPSGPWGTLLDCAQVDAASAGNILFYSALDVQTNSPDNGDTVQFQAGGIAASIS